MLEAITAFCQVVLFALLYLVILAGIASRFHQAPALSAESAAASPVGGQEALKIDFLTVAAPIAIDSPSAVFRYVSPRIAGSLVEYLVLLLLNRNNALVGEIVCTDQTSAGVRLPQVEQIVRHCRENNAAQVIVAHNHPLGTMYPSLEDVHYTNGLTARLAEKGITLADHLIVTPAGYHSLKEYCQNPTFTLR
ncbi:MAG: JAB domain-containing protein [Negativicutes bacterium]|nr:JAB domain-containing protein [Negativicutes bacterium]